MGWGENFRKNSYQAPNPIEKRIKKNRKSVASDANQRMRRRSHEQEKKRSKERKSETVKSAKDSTEVKTNPSIRS